MGENIGVDIADATVASRVVCGELMSRARGKSGGATYRINFGKLGERILLQVNEHDTNGRISDERHVQLLAIENVSAISGRIAESIVSKKPMSELETTENVLPEDEMVRRQKQGRMHFEAGLVGASLVGSDDASMNPGIHLGLNYEIKRMFLSTAIRGSGDDANRGYTELSLGGGSFFSDNEFSPYAAGGVAVLFLRDQSSRSVNRSPTTGFAPYVELGAGLFRTSKVAARAGLRVDIPMFSAASDTGKNYVMPVAFTVALSFQ